MDYCRNRDVPSLNSSSLTARICANRRLRREKRFWRGCCAARLRALPSMPTTEADGAIVYKHACALAARALYRSASARPTAPTLRQSRRERFACTTSSTEGDHHGDVG